LKKLAFYVLTVIAFTTLAFAAEYKYMTLKELEARRAAGEKIIIIDICPIDLFSKGHMPGSIEIHAYPVKTDEQLERIGAVIPTLQSSEEDIVIMCSGGHNGAQRTFDYYTKQGVAEKRLYILTDSSNGKRNTKSRKRSNQ